MSVSFALSPIILALASNSSLIDFNSSSSFVANLFVTSMLVKRPWQTILVRDVARQNRTSSISSQFTILLSILLLALSLQFIIWFNFGLIWDTAFFVYWAYLFMV